MGYTFTSEGIYVGAMDAELTAAAPPFESPADNGIGRSQAVNRVATLNASSGFNQYVTLGVLNQDDLANSLASGYIIGLLADTLCTCNSNLNFNYPVFPGGIVGGVIQAIHAGTGNLTGTNYGLVGLMTSAAVQQVSHVSTVVSLIADTGGLAGATVDKTVAIWIPSLSDPGTILGTGIGLYMAPVTPSFSTLWGIYIDGTTPSYFGGSVSVGSLKFPGSASGTATVQVAAAAGTPNPLQLPTATGIAGQVLTTDGGNPQQLSWTTVSALDSFSSITSGTNTTAMMVVGPGAVLTFGGAGSPPSEGEINANFLYGVQISGAAPSAGQVLTATSSTSASWQAPSDPLIRTVRYSAGTVTSGTLGGPYTVLFAVPFADDSYTVEATAVLGEAIASAPCSVAGVQYYDTPSAGYGVQVWVMNNDQISHTVAINVIARHD